MLPDSGANVAASQGFVSYKVKPRYGLAEGTQIKNTGYIYFDYNPAVVTNTTLNTISYFSDIAETVPGNGISVFPNPAHHEFTVTVDNVGKNETIYMYDVFGKQVLSVPVTETSTVIDVRSLSAGVYFMRLTGNNNNSVQKIIIE
jgi:hypothetical protein